MSTSNSQALIGPTGYEVPIFCPRTRLPLYADGDLLVAHDTDDKQASS